MPDTVNRLLLSLTDGADVLGVKRSTMYVLIAQGEVEAVRIGGRRLVTVESLERYVDRLKQGGE